MMTGVMTKLMTKVMTKVMTNLMIRLMTSCKVDVGAQEITANVPPVKLLSDNPQVNVIQNLTSLLMSKTKLCGAT